MNPDITTCCITQVATAQDVTVGAMLTLGSVLLLLLLVLLIVGLLVLRRAR